MSYTVVTTKIDPQTKRDAQKIAQELGLTLSTVMKTLLKQFIRTKRLEGRSREKEIPNKYLRRVLKQAEKNRKSGKGSPVFDNVEDNLKWLEEQGI